MKVSNCYEAALMKIKRQNDREKEVLSSKIDKPKWNF